MPNTDSKWWTSLLIQIAIYIISTVIAVMTAYGSLDKRLTTVEVKQESKVDGERLERQLNIVKNDIIKEMKAELEKLKKEK